MSAAVASSMAITWAPMHSLSADCAVGYGMCVSLKHGLIVISECVASGGFRLDMHSLLDGSLVRSIGSKGNGTGQFTFLFGGLCVSPDGDSVLVAERFNNRVQQVKIADGSWVRFVGVGILKYPDFVDCNADVIAVSETSLNCISVLSWADDSVLARFGGYGWGLGDLWYPLGLRLLCDGNELVVADSFNHRLCLFTVTGELVSTFANENAGLLDPCDVIEYGADGGFITAIKARMKLAHVSRAGEVTDVLDSTVSSAIQLDDPLALAALPDGGLVVRTRKRLHVFNGLNVRLSWITACAVFARPIPELHQSTSRMRTRRKLAQ
jgi:hypothetical protein